MVTAADASQLCSRCGVTFAQATTEDLRSTTEQMERLARSRYWNELRGVIGTLYQRAFGVSNVPSGGYKS